MWGAVLFLLASLFVIISQWCYTWANPKSHGKLPTGSTGFPIIGETFEFFSSNSQYEMLPFISKRMQRYGPVFRTNLFGKNIIVSTDPEINFNIFQQENKSFQFFYPESLMKIFGEGDLLTSHGNDHKYLRNLILRFVGPENLKARLLPGIDEAIRKHLDSWASFGNIDVKEGCSKMIFEYFAKILIGYDEELTPNGKLRENFQAFVDGLISFPLNIPGTAYHACLQGRKNVFKVIKDAFEKRKTSKIPCDDFLDDLLKEAECEDAFLDEKKVVNLIFVLLFASLETTSTTSTFAIKLISDHPDVLKQLTKEHEAILKARENDESGLTWQEYKSMTFTHMVITETVRLANILTGTFRKAVKDVEMKGYTIPAGWLVMVVIAAVHLSIDKYENPLQFNPWRWEGKELHSGSKTFMAFGGGIRLCAGAEFAKLQVAVLIHHMVTKYRWVVTKGGNVLRKPAGVIFPDGLHIEISEKQKC
ncbi:hypothetical protein DITRI_Ditri11bG0157300 [Diplodiscus trichospermus]